jgi:hypothetical protein
MDLPRKRSGALKNDLKYRIEHEGAEAQRQRRRMFRFD